MNVLIKGNRMRLCRKVKLVTPTFQYHVTMHKVFVHDTRLVGVLYLRLTRKKAAYISIVLTS